MQYDGESVIKEILPIFDDLNRMVESAENSDTKNEDSLVDGINLLRTKIERFFDNKSIEPFGEEGEPLDPELHDAMMTQEDKKKDDNTILSVFEKGYRYGQNSLYPAEISFLRRPHIIRSVRGQAVVFQPFSI